MSRDMASLSRLGQLMERSYLRCTDDTSLVTPELDDFANSLYKMGFINALQMVGFARSQGSVRSAYPYVDEAMSLPLDDPR